MNTLLDCCAVTDTGLRRPVNEDSYICNPDLGLFLVADGMGGESCGDVASQLTAKLFESSMAPYITDEEATIPFEHENGNDLILHAMEHAAEQTNQAVLRAVEESPSCRGMGSTLTAAVVHDDLIYIVHVGDSRLYSFQDNTLLPVTEDHTRVQEMVKRKIISAKEARTHRQRNIITRCVGRKKQFKPDLQKLDLLPGNLYMLCSDGLYDMIEDGEMAKVMAAHPTLEETGSRLVEMANQNGGKDNITLVLFRKNPNDNGESC